MARYQLRADDESIIGEGSFRSDDEARALPLDDGVPPGWTLLRRDGTQWITVRRDPARSPSSMRA